MAKVPKQELIEALNYMEIPVPDSLIKGEVTETLPGSEQNGGGSEANDLDKKKSELKEKISKAKKETEDLEKELEKCSMPGSLKKSKESDEPDPEPKEEATQESLEKSKKLDYLEKTVGHLATLAKSQHSTIENLSEKIDEFLNAPLERRSAQNFNQLVKSMGFNGLEEPNNSGEQTKKVSSLEKGKISDILMGIYTEGGSSDEGLSQTIMTYEASGHLSQPTLDLIKSKRGIEIIK